MLTPATLTLATLGSGLAPLLGLVAVLAAAAALLRALTPLGALAAFCVGGAIAWTHGGPGLIVLATFFVLGSLATRVGRARKQADGTAERGGGARGPRRVLGKGGVAALGGFLADPTGALALCGALAAALADTLGTEVGVLHRGDARLLPTLRRVPRGTPGGVSSLGTLGVLAGALLVAAAARMSGLVESAWLAVGAAGVFAALLESLLAGAVPAFARLPGFVRNVATTGVGAGLAVALGRLLAERGRSVTGDRTDTSTLAALVALARPFTLLAPALGVVAAAVAAAGFHGVPLSRPTAIRAIVLATLGAAVLNVASNAVNQVFDVEVDRINKPGRPLPSGALGTGTAWLVVVLGYAAALLCAALVNPLLAVIVAFTAFVTYAYSAPPLRTKRHWALANVTIAVPRGFLLPVAGWAAISGTAELVAADGPFDVARMLPSDILVFATAAGLFVLGAASTKDFADLEGDRAGGCITLPLRFGVPAAVKVVSGFLVVPWLLLPLGVLTGLSTGRTAMLVGGGITLTLIGARAAWLLLRDPAALTNKSTHPAWVLMYLLMLASQLVLALAYAGLRP